MCNAVVGVVAAQTELRIVTPEKSLVCTLAAHASHRWLLHSIRDDIWHFKFMHSTIHIYHMHCCSDARLDCICLFIICMECVETSFVRVWLNSFVWCCKIYSCNTHNQQLNIFSSNQCFDLAAYKHTKHNTQMHNSYIRTLGTWTVFTVILWCLFVINKKQKLAWHLATTEKMSIGIANSLEFLIFSPKSIFFSFGSDRTQFGPSENI